MSSEVPSFSVVVTGWRYWSDFRMVHEALQDELDERGQFLLGVGDCPTGADDIALRWGSHYLYWPVTVFHAPWDTHGAAAGPLRNKFMIDEFCPDLVLAFIHPTKSRGTVNCANYAESQGITVRPFFERRAQPPAELGQPRLTGAGSGDAAAPPTDGPIHGPGGGQDQSVHQDGGAMGARA